MPSPSPAEIARRHADALTAVETAAAEWHAVQKDADGLRQRLDVAIAAAVDSGIPSKVVAASSGFSPQNITLIVARTTGRPLPPSIEARRARNTLAAATNVEIATTAGATRARRDLQEETPMSKPRRDGTRWDRWEDEAIADLYIEHGPSGGGAVHREALAARMERTPATVLMRLGNVRAIVEGKGLSGYAKQTLAVAKAKGLV